MGNRAIILVKAGDEYAPCGAYIHSHGSSADGLVKAAVPHMRKDDASYSMARLIGKLHECIPDNLGLGIVKPPSESDIADGFDSYTHGNAGVLVYDCSRGTLQAFAGCQAREYSAPVEVGVPPV